MIYIESNSNDPAYNLALEQYAFDSLSKVDDIFMLWENKDSVVIGLHQNTFEEINPSFISEHGIHVVRRLSGGGAVFHDLGNLNYTLIKKTAIDEQIDIFASCKPISDALSSLGLPVEFSGRNDMTINSRKFSGNASYCRDGRLMHHGTLLFNVNLNNMEQALRVSYDKLFSKSVKSIRSRVINLSDFLDMTQYEFKTSIRRFVVGDAPLFLLSEKDKIEVESISRERYATWDWTYGKSPNFDIVKSRRLESFGTICIRLSIDNGIITSFATDGDYFGVLKCSGVSDVLRGVKLEMNALMRALEKIDLNEYYEGLSAAALARLILE